jgi:hypothetical protein
MGVSDVASRSRWRAGGADLGSSHDRAERQRPIAKLLYVSPATAKTHVSRAMIKLHARDRAQLVVIAYESGLVRPGWRT